MWKPTKAGYYLQGDDVFALDSCGLEQLTRRGLVSSDGPWSLLAPDWQDGAPTLEQLGRWQWWAVVNEDGMLMASKWQAAWGMLFSVPRMVTPGVVTRSAPVQPVPGEVLWVPLEVAK